MFECPTIKEMWPLLGIDDVITRSGFVDLVGEAMLEFLLSIPEEEVSVLGQANFKEIVVVAIWFMWWERRKFLHGEHTQSTGQILLVVRSLAANFSIACASKK